MVARVGRARRVRLARLGRDRVVARRWWWWWWWWWRRRRRRRWRWRWRRRGRRPGVPLLHRVQRHVDAVAAPPGVHRGAGRRTTGERSRVIEARPVRPRVRNAIET